MRTAQPSEWFESSSTPRWTEFQESERIHIFTSTDTCGAYRRLVLQLDFRHTQFVCGIVDSKYYLNVYGVG